jgi:RNA polymerase sigma factor (sigma-70 family)
MGASYSEICIDSVYHIVQRAIVGDQQAFTYLTNRYYNMVYATIDNILQQPEYTLEATQDTFVKAFKYLSTWRGDCKWSTWLYCIARTTALDYIRQHKAQQRRANILPEELLHHAIDIDDTPFERLVRQEQCIALLEAIEQLSLDDATILTLFYFDDLSLHQICVQMNINLSNAKSKLCRARQRLRNKCDGMAISI